MTQNNVLYIKVLQVTERCHMLKIEELLKCSNIENARDPLEWHELLSFSVIETSLFKRCGNDEGSERKDAQSVTGWMTKSKIRKKWGYGKGQSFQFYLAASRWR